MLSFIKLHEKVPSFNLPLLAAWKANICSSSTNMQLHEAYVLSSIPGTLKASWTLPGLRVGGLQTQLILPNHSFSSGSQRFTSFLPLARKLPQKGQCACVRMCASMRACVGAWVRGCVGGWVDGWVGGWAGGCGRACACGWGVCVCVCCFRWVAFCSADTPLGSNLVAPTERSVDNAMVG